MKLERIINTKIKTKHILTLIRNINYLKQSLDFTGIENGSIYPTDIDAVLEFNNDVLILMEVKYKNAEIPTGQRLVLERICNSWHTKKSVVLKVEHDFNVENEAIPLDSCIVTKIYYNSKWHNKNTNLVNQLNNLGKHFNCNKLQFNTNNK